HDLLVEASQLAVDDLVNHVRRLAGVLHLRAVDRPFLLDYVAWNDLARDIGRAGGGDLHRDFLDERDEFFPFAERGRDAAELHLDADLAPEVDVLPDVPAA